jgi:hypothetical protein
MARPYPQLTRGLARVVACGAATLACTTRDRASLSSGAPTGAEPRAGDGRVVLVTIDGARWQDVFEGSNPEWGAPAMTPEQIMPRTQALVAARGVAIGATRPGCATIHTAGKANVSLPGYQEIFTGHRSTCLDNDCAPVGRTVLDEARERKVPGVASIGSWPSLSSAVSGDRGVIVSSEGRHDGATPAGGTLAPLVAAGDDADPFPGSGAYRPDAFTAPIALEYLRAHAPAFLHVGLGDTDEWGHRGDYAAYLDALRSADALIGAIADVLDTMGRAGERTTVLVTPDHGRAANFNGHGVLEPESGRTFLLAFGGGVAPRGVVCPKEDLTLADIAPTIRVILGLPADPTEGAGKPIDVVVSRPIE